MYINFGVPVPIIADHVTYKYLEIDGILIQHKNKLHSGLFPE
jgi:hypothetical protein